MRFVFLVIHEWMSLLIESSFVAVVVVVVVVVVASSHGQRIAMNGLVCARKAGSHILEGKLELTTTNTNIK